MTRTEKMLEVLEELIIEKTQALKSKSITSPAEMMALAELVVAVNQVPRTFDTYDVIEKLKDVVDTL